MRKRPGQRARSGRPGPRAPPAAGDAPRRRRASAGAPVRRAQLAAARGEQLGEERRAGRRAATPSRLTTTLRAGFAQQLEDLVGHRRLRRPSPSTTRDGEPCVVAFRVDDAELVAALGQPLEQRRWPASTCRCPTCRRAARCRRRRGSMHRLAVAAGAEQDARWRAESARGSRGRRSSIRSISSATPAPWSPRGHQIGGLLEHRQRVRHGAARHSHSARNA